MKYVKLGHKLTEAIRMVKEGSVKRVVIEIPEDKGVTVATVYSVKNTIRIDIKEVSNED